MTSTVEHRPLLSEPFVVYFCAAPLLAEAVRTALEGIAEVRWLPAGRPGLSGLLHSLDPDAVVVDSDADADDAAAFADKAGVTLLHIGLGRPALRLRRHGCWHELRDEASPESIRNTLAASLLGRGRTP